VGAEDAAACGPFVNRPTAKMRFRPGLRLAIRSGSSQL